VDLVDRIFLGLGFLAIMVGVWFAIQGDRHAQVAARDAKIAATQSARALERAEKAILVNCDFGNQNRLAMRRILQNANRQSQTSRQRSPEEKRISNEFYKKQLKELPLFDCDRLRLGG
jgi:hypothetical protein